MVRPILELKQDLKSLPMNRPLAILIKLSFRHPHPLERIERRENRTPNPRRVQSLLRGRDADLNIFGCILSDFR